MVNNGGGQWWYSYLSISRTVLIPPHVNQLNHDDDDGASVDSKTNRLIASLSCIFFVFFFIEPVYFQILALRWD